MMVGAPDQASRYERGDVLGFKEALGMPKGDLRSRNLSGSGLSKGEVVAHAPE